METLSRWVLTFLLNALWQVALVTLVVAATTPLLRRAPATYRHVLWVIGLALSLLLPLASLPGLGKLSRLPVVVEKYVPPESEPLAPRTGLTPDLAGDSSAALSAQTPIDYLLLNLFRRRRRPIAFPPLVADAALGIYLISLLFHLARLARAWTRTRRLRRIARWRPLPREMRTLLAQCQAALGLNDVAIRASSEVAGPATVGVFQPVIILPESLFEGPPSDELAAALCHEMGHIRRRDYLLNLICEFTFLALAFHPAAWLLKRRIDETRELACDEAAAGRFLSPAAYARSLVSLAHSMAPLAPPPHPGYTLGVFDANILEERIMRLLDRRLPVSSRRARVLIGGAVLTLTLTALTAGAFSLAAVQNAKSATPAGVPRDFSGRWELDKSQSELPSPAPDNLVEVIEQRDSQLKIMATSKDWNVNKPIAVTLFALMIPELSTSTDNRESIQPYGPGQLRSKTHWEERNLVTDWTLERNGQAAVTGRWVRHLSEDGTTQTVDISAHDPLHNLAGQAKAVFMKREQSLGLGVSGGVTGGVAGGVPGGVAGGVTSASLARVASVGVIGGIVRAPNPGHAEEGAGTISGTVLDPSGARVPQASVTITNKATGARESAETDDTGDFSFTNLPPGTYTLTTTKVGFGINAQEVVPSSQKNAAPVNIVLEPGDILQAIVVTAPRAPGETSAPRPTGPQRIRIGGLIQATKLVTMKKPDYPPSARAKGIQGVVLLQAVISKEGVPLGLKVISSPDPALSQAAEDAVHEWRYEPTLLNGQPIEVVTTVAVRFQLQD